MNLHSWLAEKVTPITMPAVLNTRTYADLEAASACSWLHGVLRLFDVLSGRLMFRKLVDNDIQFLTISSRLGLSIHLVQQKYPTANPPYAWGVMLLVLMLNALEADHCSKAISADYANAMLAAGTVKIAALNAN